MNFSFFSSEDEVQDKSDDDRRRRRHRSDGEPGRRVAEVGAAVADPALDATEAGDY